MKLGRRFALNLLAPSPLAATLLAFFSYTERPSWSSLGFALIVIPFAYGFAILPSLAHALWLHRRYATGLAPRSAHATGLSTLSGTAAGLAIGLYFFVVSHGDPGGLLMFIPLGAATGTLNGLLQFLVRD